MKKNSQSLIMRISIHQLKFVIDMEEQKKIVIELYTGRPHCPHLVSSHAHEVGVTDDLSGDVLIEVADDDVVSLVLDLVEVELHTRRLALLRVLRVVHRDVVLL